MAGGIKENIDSEPEEIFLCMPKNKELYQKWIEAIRKPFIPCGPNLCCEDHSDLESDCQNWMLYKMVANQVNPKKDIAEYQGKVEGTNCSKLNNSDQRFKITTMRNLKGLCKRKEILQKLKFKCPIEKEGNDNDRASKELRCGQEKDSVVSISANTNKKIFVKDFAYNSASPIKQSSLDSLSAGTVIETNDGNAMTSSCAEIKVDVSLGYGHLKSEAIGIDPEDFLRCQVL
ncbi:uncharacterized protein [Hetaerina americana]|uniref:uncharacterized protein n=1 Tax=Hetaerina americana TaxID=62018 RepID=UPI003A7F3792